MCVLLLRMYEIHTHVETPRLWLAMGRNTCVESDKEEQRRILYYASTFRFFI
ncbi:hypothetical protein ccbrp13_65140 [Ktedonobacteria bacterium brp13]|nr:hypothetical protein ccbrp13_65140 [Ktedonobacteria bacterium brp13]